MFLVVISGKQQGKVFELAGRGTLGRDPSVEYPIDDATVSRRHAEVIEAVDGWRLRDLGSANGTEINGVRLIGDRSLREGDTIGMGRAVLAYSRTREAGVPEGAASAAPQTIQPERTEPRPLPMEGLVAQIMAALRQEERSAEEHAQAALLAIVDAVPGANRACLVDWKAGRILARAPEACEISRSMVFRALATLKSQADGAVVWLPATRTMMAEQLAASSVEPFIVMPLDAQVGLLVEGDGPGCTAEPSRECLKDASLLLRIALAELRAQAAAGSRKLRDADLRLAQRVQHKLLTPAPEELGQLEIAVSYRPAMMIGGDFYHIEVRPGDELAVVIGDVSGKGVSAALYMAFLSADLRHLMQQSSGPGELLRKVHASMRPIFEIGMFVTLAALYINTRTGLCRVGLAGHSAPVLRTAARKVMEMGLDPGLPIGADVELTIREQKLQLAPGDCLVLTTDGVDEGENQAGELFGKARRDQILLSCGSAQETNTALKQGLLEFVGRDRSTDDLTIICIGRKRS